jgi:hypothetical protein
MSLIRGKMRAAMCLADFGNAAGGGTIMKRCGEMLIEIKPKCHKKGGCVTMDSAQSSPILHEFVILVVGRKV